LSRFISDKVQGPILVDAAVNQTTELTHTLCQLSHPAGICVARALVTRKGKYLIYIPHTFSEKSPLMLLHAKMWECV